MYRRSVITRFSHLTPRLHPCFSHILPNRDDDKTQNHQSTVPIQPQNDNHLMHKCYNTHNTSGFVSLFRDQRGSIPYLPFGLGQSFHAYSSSTIGEGSGNIDFITDVAEVLVDKSAEVGIAHAPVVSEVAIAAADSAFPVAALQYFIDGVHSFSGLNWWASIVLTTILIRTATIPLLINTMKSTTKLSLMRPELEEIKQQMQDSMDPKSIAEGQKKMKLVMNKHGVTPFSPLKGLFIQGPIFVSFFFAVTNMAEKVPSFKTGGALWFTDLTTVDNLYIFPVITAAAFLLTVELNAQEGMEGNPVAGTVKKFSRLLAVLTVPFTMSFPKAIFCYWFTSNLFSLCYGMVIKRPPVKRFLGIPEIVAPPKTASQPSIPFFGGPNSVIGRAKALLEQSKSATSVASSPSPAEPRPKLPGRKVSPSSSTVLSQRVRNLERTVKGRKKTKK